MIKIHKFGAIFRAAFYVILVLALTTWIFAPYWESSYAILMNIGCAITYSFLCVLAQRVPSRKRTRKSIKKNEGLIGAAVTAMVAISAFMVPCVWYLGEEVSYINECVFMALFVLPFSITAYEAQQLAKQMGEVPLILPYRIWVIAFVCVFGFLGLKKLCQYVMNYSGDNYFASMLLLFLLTVAPILLIMGIIAYCLWDKSNN